MNEFSKNAKYALVIGASKASYGHDKRTEWQEFLTTLQNNARTIGETITIHDNVWLIPLDTGMRFLSALVASVGNNDKVLLRILFLDEEPDWIQYPPDAKSSA